MVLLPGALRAQVVPSPYRFIETRQEVGVFGGRLGPDQGPFDLGPVTGPVLGARYGIDVSGPFSLEGVATYMPTSRDIMDPRRVEGDRKVGEADVHLAMVEARLRFSVTGPRTWHRLSPFAVVGGGVVFDVSGTSEEEVLESPIFLEETDRFDFGTGFVGTLGGGVRWFVTDRIVVRTEALLTLYKLGVPDGFRLPERGFEDVGDDAWVDGTSLVVGLAYRF